MSPERATITEPSGMRAYAQLLRVPRVFPLVLSSAVGRLPLGMSGLAIILDARANGHSYGTAGVWVAAYTVGMAAISPLLGRAVDRVGAVRLLPPVGIAFGLLLTVLAELLRSDVSPWLTGAVALLAGAMLPPLSACMRTQWPKLLTPESLSVGFSFEAIGVEVAYIGGPLLTAVIVAVSPTAAIIVSGACGAVGAVMFAWFVAPISGGTSDHPRPEHHVLSSPGVRTVLLATVAVGLAFGTIEMALPAFCEGFGHRALAGLALAGFSVGSVVGGIRFGAIPASVGAGHRYRVALSAFAVLLALPLLAWSIPGMVAIMAVAGLPIAPSFAASYLLIDRLSDPGAKTETFAWLGTAVVAGAALGNGGGGLIVGSYGWRAALVLAVAATALSALVVTVRRGSLR